MKKIDFNNIPLPILVIVGIVASTVSLVYYFALKNPSQIVFGLICIIDFLLFALSAYRVIERFGLTKVKTVVFVFITMIGFFVFCEFVVFAFTVGTSIEYTFELFTSTFRVAWFLSPSFILLIPIMVFVAEIIS